MKGQRTVRNLSTDQLARKRANDRRAQQNIRRRMKAHVEFLEDYIKFLETGVEKLQKEIRPENVESVLNKNHELEAENTLLRGQLALQVSLEGESSFSQEFWSAWAPAPYNPPQPIPSPTYPTTTHIYLPTRVCDTAEASQHLSSTTSAPQWDHATDFGQELNLINPGLPWTPFQPALSQSSRDGIPNVYNIVS